MDARLNEAPCGFLSMEKEGNIVEVNRTFLEWTGYTEEQLKNEHIERLLTVANKLIFHSYFYPNINLYGTISEFFIRLRHADGTNVAYLMNARRYERNGETITDCILLTMAKRIDYELELRQTKAQLEDAYLEQEQVLAALKSLNEAIAQKQQELMEINAKLLEVSNTDKLTNIANRRYFQAKLEEYLQGFEKHDHAFSLCMIDIDYFKQVNDTYGHLTGDEVLKNLAAVVKKHLRPKDFLARYGGEEFVIILPDTDVSAAMQMAENLNKVVAHSDWGVVGHLTISIGVATCEERCTATSLVAKADEALYASKRNGRNRATHFDSLK